MKFSFKGFYHATPQSMRKAGDILLALSGFSTAIALHYHWDFGAEIAFWLGISSKFITNCFVESN
jgi:hypothetical protein